MTSLENSDMKNVAKKLSFLLVTHTTHFNIRFGRCGFLNSGYGAELILDRLR
jgi:RNA:NAD 2'-phosphotransferase (TPT1/KptA family)